MSRWDAWQGHKEEEKGSQSYVSLPENAPDDLSLSNSNS